MSDDKPLPITFDDEYHIFLRTYYGRHYVSQYNWLPQTMNRGNPTLSLDAPMYGSSDTFNELFSFVVKNMNEEQVMHKLNDILLSYCDDIDFELDFLKRQIKNGVVFINNCNCVHFTIHLRTDNDDNTTLEFSRQSGNALCSAKFFGDIKSKLVLDVHSNCLINLKDTDTLHSERCMLLIDGYTQHMQQCLHNIVPTEIMRLFFQYYFVSYAAEPWNESKVTEENKYRAALIYDQFIGDLLDDENVENYLYQKIVEQGACNVINNQCTLDYKKLCMWLMNSKAVIYHLDISVRRVSFIILNRFVNVYPELFQNNEHFVSKLNALKMNECKIIKRYVVKLLSQITVKQMEQSNIV